MSRFPAPTVHETIHLVADGGLIDAEEDTSGDRIFVSSLEGG